MCVILKQIRTGANVDGEDSQRFVDSIAEKRGIEPVVVTPREDKFLLLTGELRYLASKKLGLMTISARIFPNVQTGEAVLTIQLIENLQRREIDPIDKANGIVSFILARYLDMDTNGIINELISLRRDEKRVANEFALTVAQLVKSQVYRPPKYKICYHY